MCVQKVDFCTHIEIQLFEGRSHVMARGLVWGLYFWSSITAIMAQPYPAILIRVDATQSLIVTEIHESQIRLDEHSEGLVVWAEQGRETWKYLAPASFWEISAVRENQSAIPGWINISRGQEGDVGSSMDVIPPTAQLDQLTTMGISRAGRKRVSFEFAKKEQKIILSEKLAGLVDRTDPLYIQVAVEYLLSHKDSEGKLQPRLADALMVLESVPDQRSTSHLRRVKKVILGQLNPLQEKISYRRSPDTTGIELIDNVRGLIAANQWQEALKKLKESQDSTDIRTRALSKLYKGVIFAELGMALEERTNLLFQDSLQELTGGSAADLFLVHSTYADVLFKQAQDRLYNHAFQIAVGVEYPLIRLLLTWIQANFHYQKAHELAGQSETRGKTVVQINIARLYVLLADIIRTLDVFQDRPQFSTFTKAAEEIIHFWIDDILQSRGMQKTGQFNYAVAVEIQAHMAFRRGNPLQCMEAAQKALDGYREAGSLAGMESVYRLLGLAYLRAEPDRMARSFSENQEKALHHFLVSEVISEILQEWMAGDRVGMTQAGFFARRSYVYENIIELLLAAGKDEEALQYAEKSKAQSLKYLLDMQETRENSQSREIKTILAQWPKEIAALEYFLGTRRAYLFFIDTSGQVKGYLLTDRENRVISSRHFISQVQQFLQSMDHYAQGLIQRLKDGRGVDHSWQNRLHEFYRVLIPLSVQEELKKAKTVIVVPHHILHYLPFAALVTRMDDRDLSFFEMAKPRFFLDEPFQICNAPSLVTWDLLRQRSSHPVEQVAVLGIADFPNAPIRGVVQDIANLKAAFGDKVKTVYFNGAATEVKAWELLGQRGFLLFATHGANDPDHPLKSCIRLYPEGSNDGNLTALEIFSSRVQVDVVVMSACYSGVSDRSPLAGDDLFGLNQAFLKAGARNVVSGLWDIYDGTAPELMKVFFENCAKKMSPPDALAASQRTFLDELRASSEFEPWVHPYFWAVYSILGDDRMH